VRRRMSNCHEGTHLVAQSLDRKLPLYQRMGVRFHLFMCKFCSRYRKQMLLTHQVLERYNESDRAKDIFELLSGKAKERMKQALNRLHESNHVH
jgi:transposase